MNRSLIKFSVLALMCALAATGCKKKTQAAPPGPDLGPVDVSKNGEIPGNIPPTPAGGGALTDPTTGQKWVVHFAYDSAVVTQDKDTLSKVAEFLKSHQTLAVTVTGHCDERGSTEYNLSLGERRALSVRAYLVGLGIDGSRLSTQSFGEEQPAVQGHNESAWRENRRAEFIGH